jgi:hypothetical protein
LQRECVLVLNRLGHHNLVFLSGVNNRDYGDLIFIDLRNTGELRDDWM